MKGEVVFHFPDSLFPRPRTWILLNRALSMFHDRRTSLEGTPATAQAFRETEHLFKQAFQTGSLVAFKCGRNAFRQRVSKAAWDSVFISNPYGSQLSCLPLTYDGTQSPEGSYFVVGQSQFLAWLAKYAAKPPLRKTKSTKGYDWPAFYDEVKKYISQNGKPEVKAILIQHMADWCGRAWSLEPADSTIKLRVDEVLKRPGEAE
jgi:hypothetical protein